MTRSRISVTFLALTLTTVAAAQTARPATQPAASRPTTLTVAILDFAAGSGATEVGAQIAELLTTVLSGEPGFRLVERATLQRVLEEQSLNLTGLVETDQAVKVGKLIGARILVTGKVFTVGSRTFMTAKLIGTETTLVEGVLVQEEGQADYAAMAVTLAEKLGVRLREAGPRLVAQEDAGADPLPRLKAALAGKRKPVVAVIIPEQQVPRRTPVPDPAVETEIKRLLLECGFQIQDVKQNELADFARRLPELSPDRWPAGLAGVDVVIVGEGLSEFGARIGNLVSCAARAEINVIERTTGRIVLADRTTQRAVDLAEAVAAKKALEKAGRVLGLAVLEHFAK